MADASILAACLGAREDSSWGSTTGSASTLPRFKRGAAKGKPREKFTSIDEMLAVRTVSTRGQPVTPERLSSAPSLLRSSISDLHDRRQNAHGDADALFAERRVSEHEHVIWGVIIEVEGRAARERVDAHAARSCSDLDRHALGESPQASAR